jgi:hypothetical protein
VKRAVKSESFGLEDLAILEILGTLSDKKLSAKINNAGGQRWKGWLRERK